MSNLCYHCGGYGTDPWNDHILPCPVCDGEEGDLLGFDDEWMDDNGEGE